MNESPTLRSVQEQVDAWISTTGVRYFSELTNLGILMEEVGELSRLMVRKYGDQSFKQKEAEKKLLDDSQLRSDTVASAGAYNVYVVTGSHSRSIHVDHVLAYSQTLLFDSLDSFANIVDDLNVHVSISLQTELDAS